MRIMIVAVGVALCAGASSAALVTVVANGASDYVIVVAEDAIAPAKSNLPDPLISPERTAAQELQKHLQAVTGAVLPIQTDAEAATGPKQIVIGPSPRFPT